MRIEHLGEKCLELKFYGPGLAGKKSRECVSPFSLAHSFVCEVGYREREAVFNIESRGP